MSTTTPRIGLTKPDGTDLVDIAVLNTNFDKIDSNIASTKIQSTKPTTANAGDLWWDSDTGTLYLYYTDANSSQWVAATSDPINIGVVANQTERDAQYPTPAQGMSVYRTDLGVTQRYYGLFNASTNPGGRDSAGWYDTEKSIGLVPIQPTSAVIATGTGSANALGVVSFTGATTISLNGIFSANYANYRMLLNIDSATEGTSIGFRLRNAGTDLSSAVYNFTRLLLQASTFANDGVYSTTNYQLALVGAGKSAFSTDIFSPFQTKRKALHTQGWSGINAIGITFTGALVDTLTTYDGMSLFIGSGTFSGTVQVFGYNK